ncbi:hypothetical protein CC1G_06608 [Coprinopsis cinerea okayama7|uniref:Uncharacterized protein n=1 Tax=Coprinopsis cinerea (strain Okayama-7 / 130 / ATCC MYA-4618 / FGSC 9003) TaxID=240176 RepID=A8N2X3_COPC7|nr:hypothetical protein CC1G_06608 [Coprinopsis cinerea okayama7\|eukprot:XP_001829271.1 hypothetical protein CC1G_06608 [Coprinopsis cinerea okayama7\
MTSQFAGASMPMGACSPHVQPAFNFVATVKMKLDADAYGQFMGAMKSLYTSRTPDQEDVVIEQMARLFVHHEDLLQGFTTFLPAGYELKLGNDFPSVVMKTPNGVTKLIVPSN